MSEFPSYESAVASRNRRVENNARRREQQLDLMDCALSYWADSNGPEGFVIASYELGKEVGVDGPVDIFWRLVDAEGNPVDAKMVRVYDRFKFRDVPKWVMSDAAAAEYGRKWWPFNGRGRSRVLNAAGLREEKWYAVVKSYGSNCAFVGAPISYYGVEDGCEWVRPVSKEVA